MGEPRLTFVMPVRNEEWSVEAAIRAAMKWCDSGVVLNHNSTDQTPGILARLREEYQDKLHVIQSNDADWNEMYHRQNLLTTARSVFQPTHVAMIDADEIITGNLIPYIRKYIFDLAPRQCLTVKMFANWRALGQYRDDGSVWSRVKLSLAFADHPDLHWDDRNGYHFHHRHPFHSVSVDGKVTEPGGVMHLQWVQWERMIAKHRLYKLTEVRRWPGREPIDKVEQRYNQASSEEGLQTKKIPAEYWRAHHGDVVPYIRASVPPWQNFECQKILQKDGVEPYRGLSMFGRTLEEIREGIF